MFGKTVKSVLGKNTVEMKKPIDIGQINTGVSGGRRKQNRSSHKRFPKRRKSTKKRKIRK